MSSQKLSWAISALSKQRGAVSAEGSITKPNRDEGGRFARLFAKRSVKPGEQFGAPGQGSNTLISTVTVIVLFLLWVVATETGMVKPLFLPSPQAVFAKFIVVSTEGFSNSTLAQHTLTSLYRIFTAFF